MVTTTSNSRLRQIAILVSSVDSASARHLLLNLPSEIARKVRAMAAEMGPIPPEERKELMLELQKHQLQRVSSSTRTPSVEQEASEANSAMADRIWSRWSDEPELPFEAASENVEAPGRGGPAWTRLSVEAMVRFVRHERPTVIAVILHQLPARQAAAVLQRLPRSTSREVLRHLGSMQTIDHEAMQAIDEHLSQRLSEYRHKIETEAENVRRIHELLEAAPAALKQQWASWIHPESSPTESYSPAGSLTSHSPVAARPDNQPPESAQLGRQSLDPIYRTASIATQDVVARGPSAGGIHQGRSEPNRTHALNPDATDESAPHILPFQPRNPGNSKSASGDNVLSQPTPTSGQASGQAGGALERQRPEVELEWILRLTPDKLASLLSQMDSHTVLLSLAGARPDFMKRFNAMLQPADARILNDRIQRIGPLQLRDVEEAQRRIVQAYQAMVEPAGLRRAA